MESKEFKIKKLESFFDEVNKICLKLVIKNESFDMLKVVDLFNEIGTTQKIKENLIIFYQGMAIMNDNFSAGRKKNGV